MDRYASGNVERKWSKQVRDLPDKEEPRLGPYRSKKGPNQPQQGGAKEKTASDQKNTETMQRVTQEPAGEKKRNSSHVIIWCSSA